MQYVNSLLKIPIMMSIYDQNGMCQNPATLFFYTKLSVKWMFTRPKKVLDTYRPINHMRTVNHPTFDYSGLYNIYI